MPKVTVTIAYDSLEEAFADLMPQPQMNVEIRIPDDSLGANVRPDVQPTLAERTETTDSETPEPVVKKARKPRADAGKPRGPYKEKAAEAPADVAATAATEVAGGASDAVGQKADQTAVAATPAPAAQKEPTLDDVKAAMSVLSKKVNIDANIKLLAQFGVDRSSLLPKVKYAEFIAAALKAAGVA